MLAYPTDLPRDLAADSLDVLELALVLEEEFGFPLPERVLSDVRSYGDLVSATATLARARRAAEARSSRALRAKHTSWRNAGSLPANSSSMTASVFGHTPWPCG